MPLKVLDCVAVKHADCVETNKNKPQLQRYTLNNSFDQLIVIKAISVMAHQ